MLEDLHMAELLCTRLCHDLTGPIGAVNNGAEFLSEEGFNLQNQAVDLITTSAFSAVARLQFYRMAYGKVRDHGEASLSERQQLASEFFSDTKVTLDWPDSHADAVGISISVKMSRLMFNLLLIASGALIRGGTIALRIGQGDNGKFVQLTAEGPTIKWDPEVEGILDGAITQPMTPKNVQTYLTKRFADELGAEIAHRFDGNQLILQAMQPIANTAM